MLILCIVVLIFIMEYKIAAANCMLVCLDINDAPTKWFHMGQGIQEWTKQNMWKTVFKNITWCIL